MEVRKDGEKKREGKGMTYLGREERRGEKEEPRVTLLKKWAEEGKLRAD